MKKKTRAIAYGGIGTALTFVLCWLGSVTASAKIIMPAVCGILLMVFLRHISGKVALAVYVASSVLLLLLPNRLTSFAYILFLGYYPLLCESLKKLPVWLRRLLKLAVLTAVGCIMLFAGAAMLGLWENEEFVQHIRLLILAFYGIAGVYDMFLWLLRWKFDTQWDQKLQKLIR